jgi:hypothetical protein
VVMWLLLFSAKRPAVWFAQAEAQFTLASISSEQTKFCYMISQLDQHYTVEVEDIITSPPEQNPYTTLKTELVTRLSPSREQRIHQFLTLEMEELQTVPVPQTTQKPRSRCARQLPPQHLVQLASPQPIGHYHRSARGRLQHRSPLCRPHH